MRYIEKAVQWYTAYVLEYLVTVGKGQMTNVTIIHRIVLYFVKDFSFVQLKVTFLFDLRTNEFSISWSHVNLGKKNRITKTLKKNESVDGKETRNFQLRK